MLVDRDYESLLTRRMREPAQQEVQSVRTHNDRLKSASGLDPEALRGSSRDVRVECGLTRIDRP